MSEQSIQPAVGEVDFGSLRRLEPISRQFGFDRGRCIDRYYIEGFLERHSADIRGRVLEVAENTYTRRFGGRRVTQSEILHVEPGAKRATIIADLTREGVLCADSFDCIILTQTLPFIYDVHAAVRSVARILKPGGAVLATFAGISQISRYDCDRWGDYWRFTSMSARRLFEEAFPAGSVRVESHGNVLAAVGFLHGLAAEDMKREELDYHDRDYELIITVRAVKPGEEA